MNLQLFTFQKKSIKKILEYMFIENKKIITLEAPTGAGKTIILSKLVDVINDIIENDSDAPSLIELDFTKEELSKFNFNEIQSKLALNEFVWFSPSTGGLTTQSKSSYDEKIGNNSKTLNEFINDNKLENNMITFIGMSSINSNDNIARKDSENMNWNDAINKKKLNNVSFIAIIDESHLNDTDKRKELLYGSNEIEGINPIYQINASATPIINENDVVVTITDDEVIEEGLITKHIKINNNVPTSKNKEQDQKILIDVAINKYYEIKNKYEEFYKKGICNELINPLIVIQYPNKNFGDELFDEINSYIKEKGFSDDEGGEIAKWMTVGKVEQKINLDNITNNNNNVMFLHMKQAVATGWNCPRAKILIKLREEGSPTFETQVIGRFRRMPEKKHYNSYLLDNCFIYTYDQKWLILGEEKGTFMKDIITTKKNHIKLNENIKKELRNHLNMTIGPAELLNIIKEEFINKYKLTDNSEENKNKLKNNKYIFKNNIYYGMKVGDADHTKTLFNEVELQKRVNVVKDDSLFLRKSYETINSKTKINDIDVCKKLLKRLFEEKTSIKSKEDSGFLLNLTHKEFLQFVVNNEELLYKDIREFLNKKQNQIEQRKIANIIKNVYELPNEYNIKIDTRILDNEEFKNNAYASVCHNIKSSIVEEKFNEYIDNKSDINWWMKNGDSGDEFLSIVYITITGKQYQFYPDYICSINNKLWIIETKGGENTEGNNENIDPQAENKFYALKDWAKQNNVNFGFVRYSKLQDKLYISNTEYTEELNLHDENTPWKDIDTIL